MSKLNYSFDTNEVTVTEYRGEKFSDENVEIVSVHTFAIADVPAELAAGDTVKSLAGYGLQKLLQDRTSQIKDAGEKVVAMQALFSEFLCAGLWKTPAKERTSTGGGSRRKITATLAQAVADLLGSTALEAEANLKALAKEKFDLIMANEKVVARVAELQAELATADGSSLDDLI